MGRLAQTDALTESEQDILATVRDFTNREIIPAATELEHRDEYPAQIVEGMKKLGLFGLTIGEGTAEIQKMIVGRRLLEEFRTTG